MNEVIIPENIVEEVERRFFDIPFDNSDFQNIQLVIAGQYTPCRGYRALGLRLMQRIEALREAKYNLKVLLIDIEELEDKKKNSANQFEIRRKEAEIERKKDSCRYTEKLVNDCSHEIGALYNYLKKFPEFTREQFEAEEQEHFRILLERNLAGFVGAKDSLDLITANKGEFDAMLEQTKQDLLE